MDPKTILRNRKEEALNKAKALVDLGEAEDRSLTPDEVKEYDKLLESAANYDARIARLDETEKREQAQSIPANVNVNFTPRGETEERNIHMYIAQGATDGLSQPEQRASNDTSMNITTDADGGYLVPTGHYNGIIAKRSEQMLTDRLGVTRIPGAGTTVGVPVDASTNNGEFVSTAESIASDRDAPIIAKPTMTLVKYTKRLELTNELLIDETSTVMNFITGYIARGMAFTHNGLLLTEAATNGTNSVTFAGAAAIADGEPEDIVAGDNLGNYLDDSGSVAWVMRNSTHWHIKKITGTARKYEDTPGSSGGRTLLEYPVHLSNKAAAIATTAVTCYFGNWSYMGYREAPEFTFLRDPYSRAQYGEIVLHYYFRTVYRTLISEALEYADQA